MTVIYEELAKCVALEYDKLLRPEGPKAVGRVSQPEISNQESKKLLNNSVPVINGTVSIVIEINDSKTTNVESTRPNYTKIRFPIAITVITLLQIICYEYDRAHRVNNCYSEFAKVFLFRSNNHIEFWRYLTYMFLHQNAVHLYMNVFFQLLAGISLERQHGWWRTTLIYVIGALGGSLGVESLSNSKALVGGSAGVYSLLGAHFSSLILNWNETEDRLIRIFILIVNLLTDIFNWICIPQIANNSQFGSATCVLVSELTNSTITHACGFIFGILLGIIILKNIRLRVWERKLQMAAFVVLTFLISLAICLIIYLPEFNLKELIKNLKCDTNVVQVVKDVVVKCQKVV